MYSGAVPRIFKDRSTFVFKVADPGGKLLWNQPPSGQTNDPCEALYRQPITNQNMANGPISGGFLPGPVFSGADVLPSVMYRRGAGSTKPTNTALLFLENFEKAPWLTIIQKVIYWAEAAVAGPAFRACSRRRRVGRHRGISCKGFRRRWIPAGTITDPHLVGVFPHLMGVFLRCGSEVGRPVRVPSGIAPGRSLPWADPAPARG